jgi:hypothetical protein
MPVVADFLGSRFANAFELAKQPNDPFKFDRQVFKAKELVTNTAQYFDKIAWYKGRIKAGHGVLVDSDCFVAWHKKCPVIVPVPNLDQGNVLKPDGLPAYFRYSICGHFSGGASTFLGAVQDAALHAIELDGDTSESDSRWLQKGKKAFFEAHGVDIDTDQRFTFAEVADYIQSLENVPESGISL